jgi:N-acetylglucosaminyl-diphospho-decaprenol L-rhamnosyltransferase
LSRFNVSVIVVNYNCHTTLKDCIKSILLSKGVGELLLVDNASTDGSMDLIEKYTADLRLKIIRLSRNIGLAGARNLAATKTSSDYLAFTDADTVVDPDWLQEPCFLLETHKEIGAVQCKILSWKHLQKIDFEEMELSGVDWKTAPKEMVNSSCPILFPNGVAFIIRRDVWDLVKGFDSAFFVGNDDVDLGVRLWLSGFEVVCSSEGIVYHEGGHLRRRKDIAPIFLFYGHKNMLSIWTKDLQAKTLVKQLLPFSLLYPLMTFLDAGVWGVMGMLSFLESLPLILVKRYEVQQLRKISDDKILTMMHSTGTLPIRLFINDFQIFYKYILRRIGAKV